MSQEAAAFFRQFNPAWKAFGVYYIGVILFTVGPLINPEAPVSPALSNLLATCFAGFVIIKRFTSRYELDAQQVRAEVVFPLRRSMAADISRITRIDLRRGITQRLLGVAHVHIYTAEQPEPVVKLFGVPYPEVFKKILLARGASDTVVTGAWRR